MPENNIITVPLHILYYYIVHDEIRSRLYNIYYASDEICNTEIDRLHLE